MSRRRGNYEYLHLPDFKHNGFTISPKVDKSGVFIAELPDGEIIRNDTAAGMRKAVRDYLKETKNIPRPAVDCFIKRYSGDPQPAVYVGRKRGTSHSCFMFDVGQSNGKQERKYLSASNIENGGEDSGRK